MKLFLASQAKHPKTIEDLKGYVGGFEGKTIAYIPTASNGEIDLGGWVNGESWKVVNSLGANITTVQLEDYKDERVIDLIRGKDIVWFAGGIPSYLMYWIIMCKLDLSIKNILNEGTIYVGSSAGSMICSPNLNIESWYPEINNRVGKLFPGLNLVDFEIYPHYEDSMLPLVKEKFTGEKLYLLKDGESIIVEDNKVQVLGEERIIKNN